MLPLIIGIFFILHGLVHLLWFVVPWRITTVDGLPYSTRVLGQRFDVGDTGIRMVGLLWLAATLGWVIAGGGIGHVHQHYRHRLLCGCDRRRGIHGAGGGLSHPAMSLSCDR